MTVSRSEYLTEKRVRRIAANYPRVNSLPISTHDAKWAIDEIDRLRAALNAEAVGGSEPLTCDTCGLPRNAYYCPHHPAPTSPPASQAEPRCDYWCPNCHALDPRDRNPVRAACVRCKGYGTVALHKCPDCEGTGRARPTAPPAEPPQTQEGRQRLERYLEEHADLYTPRPTSPPAEPTHVASDECPAYCLECEYAPAPAPAEDER